MASDELKLLLVNQEPKVLVKGGPVRREERFTMEVVAAYDITSKHTPEGRGGVAMVLWDFADPSIRPEGRITFARLRPVRDDGVSLGRPEERIVYTGIPDVDAFCFRFMDLEKVAEVEKIVERHMEQRVHVWEVDRAHQRRHRTPVKEPRTVELVKAQQQPAVVHRGPAPPPRHRVTPRQPQTRPRPMSRGDFADVVERLRAVRDKLK